MFTSAAGTPWQPPSCSAASIMSTLVLTAINTSLLEQRPAPESCVRDEYDFVVVGGGSAGCVLASRLSENPDWSVLLLEAGGEQPEVTKVPAFFFDIIESPLNWQWRSEPQTNGVCERGCEIAKGKGLGGGSAINSMFYVRGNPADFQFWKQPFWTYEQALPFFKKSENNRDPDIANDTTHHSTGGPLSVQRMLYRDQNVGIFLKALAEIGLPAVDFNSRSQIGLGLYQFTVNGSERDSTNSAFLKPARQKRKNLRIVTQAYVTKVLFHPGTTKVAGVRLIDHKGVQRKVIARKEVVLATGALGNPQLLMHSGLGPADHLKQMNIPVVLDLPVGENLQDHPNSQAVVFLLNGTETEPADVERRVADLVGYLQQRGGPLTSEGVMQVGAFRRSTAQPPDDPRPYFQYVIEGQPGQKEAENHGSCRQGSRSVAHYSKVEARITLLHPRSRGRVWLDSADPLRPPRIQLNLLGDEEDVRVMAAGLRGVAQLGDTEALRSRGVRMEPPNGPGAPEQCRRYAQDDDRLWECRAKASARSIYHYVGTCRIGDVVDERLAVRGVTGLRVADASVIPELPSGNSNAPTIMVAERAACIIRKHHQHGYRPPKGQVC